jgi:outer membrane protein assembly factor BamB
MFHVKQRRFWGLIALGMVAVLLAGCVRTTSRGWSAPAQLDDTQVVSVSKGKLDGIDTRSNPPPAWTGTLTVPLAVDDTRLASVSVSPTDTPFHGDLLRIESEIVRVRSLTINGSEREMHLDRGFAGTTASAHAAGVEIEAFRRAWRFPDDWHIRESGARDLDGVYGTAVTDRDGVMYVGDYGGWVYAFHPDGVNLDAATDNDEPDVAVVDLGEPVIGGVTLDEDTGLLYVTAGEELFAVSTERLKASLAAGGGEVEPEAGFRFKSGGDLWAAPAVEDGVIYVTSLDGKLYALDGATGSVRWTFDGSESLATTPVIEGNLILVGGFDSKMFGVNKSDGSLAWEFETTNWILATPTIDDGTAYFGDFDGVLYAIDAQSGAARWSLALDRGKIRGSAAISGDFVVVGTNDGWLIGVNRSTQQRAWEADVGSDILADLVPKGDDVLIAPQGCETLAGGEVETYYRAVEAATGTLRRVEGLC